MTELPSVSMSASWFLVSTYLIWISGSKSVLSINQSSATLWVLDKCLIVGLLPLISILITAPLSSKMYNWDWPWEEFAFVVTYSSCDNWSTISFSFFFWVWICHSTNSFLLLGWLVFWFSSMNVTLLSPPPINQEQVIHPLNTKHPTKWFLILWICGILTFLSCTSN